MITLLTWCATTVVASSSCNLVYEGEDAAYTYYPYCTSTVPPKTLKLPETYQRVLGRYVRVGIKNNTSDDWTLIKIISDEGCCSDHLVGAKILPQSNFDYLACAAFANSDYSKSDLKCRLIFENNKGSAFVLSVERKFDEHTSCPKLAGLCKQNNFEQCDGTLKVSSSNFAIARVKGTIVQPFYCAPIKNSYKIEMNKQGYGEALVEIADSSSKPSLPSKKRLTLEFTNKKSFELAQTQIINSIVAAELAVGADNTRLAAVTNFAYQLSTDRKTLTYTIEFNK